VDEKGKSGRRRFVRRLLKLGAAASVAGVLLTDSPGRPVIPAVNAAVSGVGTSGQVAFWTDSAGSLGGFGVWDPTNGNLALGSGNTVNLSNQYATVGGGTGNTASANKSTVAGGLQNSATNIFSSIGGGYLNSASGYASTIGGGQVNAAGGGSSVIGGGYTNSAGGPSSTVAGGEYNSAGGQGSTVGGGIGNIASGFISTVPGGTINLAGAEFSFAAGSYATIDPAHHGAILFSDDTFEASGVIFNSKAPDEFAVRATGGVRFVTGIDASGAVTHQLTVTTSGFVGVSTSGASTPEYAVDLRTPGTSSAQMHISPTDTDSGGYLTSANAGNLFMSAGAAWNGSAWVAKSSTAYQYGGGVAGVRFFFDSGLTVGNTYTPTTRMFIGPTGHVGIGMSTAPAHLLQLGLDDAAKPSTNTWTIASDGRLKDPESIEPFTEGSELIRSLPQPVWFRYRKESGLPSDRRVAGWIAQDVAPVAPFMVRRTKQRLSVSDADETETLSLNTNELPYALLNSVKELLEKQGQLESENSTLREENIELEHKINALRSRMDNFERSRSATS
jgi:hypothetical protein